MSKGERIFNFSAGPGILPEPVLEQLREDLWNIEDSGIGLLEHSHRGKVIDRVFEEAEADCRELAGISEDYAILFLTGGASSQFYMVPANLLGDGETADYLVTGAWSEKAAKEARFYGNVHEACSSKDRNFAYIPTPQQTRFSDSPAYVHFTSNNTIFGTQFRAEPAPPKGVPLVCDASSDIFSRPIDVSKYGLIYAGAQKNLGPAGVTLVIVRRDLLEKSARPLPTMLRYSTHAQNDSRYNTPPVFAIRAVGLVFKWIKSSGGLTAMQAHNREKAAILYEVLDSSGFWTATAENGSRSLMNVCFRAPNEDLEKKFIEEAKAAGMDGLKGHRSVGGMRASIYNAFPEEGCVALAQFMREFEKRNG